jgi:hypothetical protein
MIGFHAAYLNQAGHAVETGTGNALLGAYLNKLGLPDRAVVFITQSSSESMTWLSPETAAREGIDVSLFPPPENKPAAAPPQLAAVAPPATKSKEPKAAPPKAAAFTPSPGQLPYLFDQIKKPAYRASLNAVMADRVDLPLGPLVCSDREWGRNARQGCSIGKRIIRALLSMSAA